MEKKYPGTYKRHLVRPIVRSNAVEKLIKKKSSISHKGGVPPTKRFDPFPPLPPLLVKAVNL